MPLPTDPKTIFLGGLFFLACMAALYVAAEIVLPLILAIVLKLLLQPFVRLLERIHIPRAIGAVLSVLLVLVAFGGTISMSRRPCRRPGRASCRTPFRNCVTSSASCMQPIDAGQRMMKQIHGYHRRTRRRSAGLRGEAVQPGRRACCRGPRPRPPACSPPC